MGEERIMRLGALVVGAGVGYVLGNEEARRKLVEMSERLRGTTAAQDTVGRLRTKAPFASDLIEQLAHGADAASPTSASKRAS
jgi:hypothetical protein